MGYLIKHGVTGETYYRCLDGVRARRVAVSMSMNHNQTLEVRWEAHNGSTRSVAFAFQGQMTENEKEHIQRGLTAAPVATLSQPARRAVPAQRLRHLFRRWSMKYYGLEEDYYVSVVL